MTYKELEDLINYGDDIFAKIFGVSVTKNAAQTASQKGGATMTASANINLEMERIDILSAVEAFNKKAKLVGAESIVVGTPSTTTNMTAAEKISKLINGKCFAYASSARNYLKDLGFDQVGRCDSMFSFENIFATIVYEDGNYKIDII